MNCRPNRRHRSNPSRCLTEALEPRAYFTAISFIPAKSVPTGALPAAIQSADLSGNGVQDIVTANYGNGTVSVLRGTGTGTFAPAVSYPVGNGPDGLAVADVNGDGKPDIIVANSGTNSADPQNTLSNCVSVLLNNGDGTFAAANNFATGVNPTDVVVADMNGDGKPDLLVTSSQGNTVRISLNNGDGTFTAVKDFATGIRPFALAVGDFNGDGNIDVATANSAFNTVSVLFGNGDGTLQTRNDYLCGAFPRAIAVADVNQDGRPDVVVACRGDNSVSVLIDLPKGTLADNVVLNTGGGPFGVAVADLNGDHLNDIITAGQAGRFVNVLQRSTVHTFLDHRDFRAGNGNEAVTVGDFNGDGQPDLAVASFNDSTVRVLLNDSNSLKFKKATVKVTASANPVTVGNAATFTATVTGFGAVPQGNATFFDGANSLGTVPFVNGVATFTAAGLAVGLHSINVYYDGSSTFAANSSPVISQLVTPIATGPDLVGAFVSTNLPNGFVAGETAHVQFMITNQGNTVARGLLTNAIYLSLNGTAASPAVPVSITGSLAKTSVNLLPGQSVVLTGAFTVPANVPVNNYTLLAVINSTGTISEPDVTNNLANSPGTYASVHQFGFVGQRPGTVLNLPDINGSPVSYMLSGPGYGVVTSDGNAVDIALFNTTAATMVTISSRAKLAVNALSSTGPVGAIMAPNITLSGSLALAASASRVTLGDVGAATLSVGVGAPMNLVLGAVNGATFNSLSTIQSLLIRGDVTNSSILAGTYLGTDNAIGGGDDTFAAGVIGSVRVTGNVTGSLFAAGLDMDTNTLLPGGKIGSLVITGEATTSRFLAATLPVKASIAGTAVATATDPRFQIGDA